MYILGIDPGRYKFGAAVINIDKHIIYNKIIYFNDKNNSKCIQINLHDLLIGPLFNLINEVISRYSINAIALGNKTASKEYFNVINNIFQKLNLSSKIEIKLVDESYTTINARLLYFKYNPPCFLLKWLPYTLIPIFNDIDDYAAALIAINYLKSLNTN